MGAAGMLRGWSRRVCRMVPDLHGHQVRAITLLAVSLCLAGRCQSMCIAICAPVAARPASTRRRMERFLANERINTPEVAMDLVRAMLGVESDHRGTAWLLLDETPLRNRLRCMKISLACRGRALPLAWTCYREDRLPATQPEIVRLLCHQVSQCLPTGRRVVLMADRGLSWPSVVDLCGELEWDYLLRVQGQTVVKRSDGGECRIDQLAPVRGRRWFGSAHVFKQAGWRWCQVVAVWERRQAEPWLLITSLPAHRQRCANYRRRMWQEESFGDEKSHGFGLDQSRVTDPEHAERLLLVMQLATWMTILLGLEVIRRGRRWQVDATSAPSLSVFQVGYRAWSVPSMCSMIRGPTASTFTFLLDDPGLTTNTTPQRRSKSVG